MDFLDILTAIARFLHIVMGVFWVGFGAFAAWVMHPVAARTENGYTFLQKVHGSTIMPKVMPIAAITTTIAGLYLYWQGNLVPGLGAVGNAILGIGALAGLAAFGHGIALGRSSSKFAAMRGTPEEIAAAGEKLARSGRVSAILALVAIIFMAAARPLGGMF